MERTTFMEMFAASGDDGFSQVTFSAIGTQSWKVPPNVYAISMVAVQGGQGGGSAGGDGGRLRYINNVAVTPGETLTVVVGAGGASALYPTTSSAGGANAKGTLGGHSSVRRGNTALLATDGSMGVGYLGGVGGRGNGYNNQNSGGGGGGAAGYAGNGGNGSSGDASYGTSVAKPGTGGAGGGGGRVNGYWDGYSFFCGFNGADGGGVGLNGQGESGAAGVDRPQSQITGLDSYADWGKAGSQGEGVRGVYGGGGGGGNTWVSTSDGVRYPGPGNSGNSGAVRIIWPGNLRQFPSTRTADE